MLCHSGVVMVLFQWRVSYSSNTINQNVCHAIGWPVFVAVVVQEEMSVKCFVLYGVSECMVSLSCFMLSFCLLMEKMLLQV